MVDDNSHSDVSPDGLVSDFLPLELVVDDFILVHVWMDISALLAEATVTIEMLGGLLR